VCQKNSKVKSKMNAKQTLHGNAVIIGPPYMCLLAVESFVLAWFLGHSMFFTFVTTNCNWVDQSVVEFVCWNYSALTTHAVPLQRSRTTLVVGDTTRQQAYIDLERQARNDAEKAMKVLTCRSTF